MITVLVLALLFPHATAPIHHLLTRPSAAQRRTTRMRHTLARLTRRFTTDSRTTRGRSLTIPSPSAMTPTTLFDSIIYCVHSLPVPLIHVSRFSVCALASSDLSSLSIACRRHSSLVHVRYRPFILLFPPCNTSDRKSVV